MKVIKKLSADVSRTQLALVEINGHEFFMSLTPMGSIKGFSPPVEKKTSEGKHTNLFLGESKGRYGVPVEGTNLRFNFALYQRMDSSSPEQVEHGVDLFAALGGHTEAPADEGPIGVSAVPKLIRK